MPPASTGLWYAFGTLATHEEQIYNSGINSGVNLSIMDISWQYQIIKAYYKTSDSPPCLHEMNGICCWSVWIRRSAISQFSCPLGRCVSTCSGSSSLSMTTRACSWALNGMMLWCPDVQGGPRVVWSRGLKNPSVSIQEHRIELIVSDNPSYKST